MATIQLKKLGAATYTTIDLQKFFKSLGNFSQDGHYLKIDNSIYDIRQINHGAPPNTEEIDLLFNDIGDTQRGCSIDEVMNSIARSGYNGIQKIITGAGEFYAKTSTFTLDEQIHN